MKVGKKVRQHEDATNSGCDVLLGSYVGIRAYCDCDGRTMPECFEGVHADSYGRGLAKSCSDMN